VGVGEKGKIGLRRNIYTSLRKLPSAPFGIGRELVDNKGRLVVGKCNNEGGDPSFSVRKRLWSSDDCNL